MKAGFGAMLSLRSEEAAVLIADLEQAPG